MLAKFTVNPDTKHQYINNLNCLLYTTSTIAPLFILLAVGLAGTSYCVLAIRSNSVKKFTLQMIKRLGLASCDN